MTAWTRNRLQNEEDEKKKLEEAAGASGSRADRDIFESGTTHSYSSPFTPKTAFQIRNRLLSKMGTPVRLGWVIVTMVMCHQLC